MKIKILSVHPTVTRIDSHGTTTDIPTDWFPHRPEVGQIWELTLHRDTTYPERVAELNQLLGTS